MKTKLLYHENSFTFECSAKVVAIEGDEVALDATVFYPGGGGQMADHGTISWDDHQIEASVIAMNKRDDIVWHTLELHTATCRNRSRRHHRLGFSL